jgi:hypothetical protein
MLNSIFPEQDNKKNIILQVTIDISASKNLGLSIKSMS